MAQPAVVFRYEGSARRLDRILSEASESVPALEGWTRSQCKQLIDQGLVRLGENVAHKAGVMVTPGTTIVCDLHALRTDLLEATPMPLSVVYEDDYLVVVDKPAGLPVHPGNGTGSHTLLHGLIAHFHTQDSVPDLFVLPDSQAEPLPTATPLRPGVVHRLDKDTTGLIVVAKDTKTLEGLAQQFRDRTITREYLALALSSPRRANELERENEGCIDLPIGRDARVKVQMAVNGLASKPALTHWRVLERFHHATFFSLRLGTGRTHQIRVHLAAMGAPLIGDPVYGTDHVLPTALQRIAVKFGRQALHAALLGFVHPVTHSQHEFKSALPIEFHQLKEAFRG